MRTIGKSRSLCYNAGNQMTPEDLPQIRAVVREEVPGIVLEEVDRIIEESSLSLRTTLTGP